MVSKAKLYSKLDDLEAQLKEEFIPHLRDAANGNNDFIFCVTQFNSFRELKHLTDKTTEECIELGAQILSLQDKLGESSTGTLAERICWYCRKWSKADKYNKETGVALAKQLLTEIENTKHI